MLSFEVLSFGEFRRELATTLRRVQQPGAQPVFVGTDHKPEAVVMSVARYRELVEAHERREDIAEALASVRAEGLEPSYEDLVLFEEVAAGRMTTRQARRHLLERYRVAPPTGDLDICLIDEPPIPAGVPARPCRVDHQRSEPLHPPIHRHVINLDTAFSQ